MTELTPRKILEHMPDVFVPSAANGLDVTIQFLISGKQGGNWYLTIQNNQCTSTEGILKNPSATMTTSDKVYVNMATGKLDPLKAVMLQKVKLRGNVPLFLKMEKMFKRPDSL